MDDLYAHLVEELTKTPDCGYMLLGYCYGGILAYELYQKIRREGIQEPFHIFMSATDAATAPFMAGRCLRTRRPGKKCRI